MRPALLALTLLPLTAAAQTPPLPKPCEQPQTKRVDARQPVRPQKLGEMPPGKQMLAVLREVDGCYRPVVVRDQVGMPSR